MRLGLISRSGKDRALTVELPPHASNVALAPGPRQWPGCGSAAPDEREMLGISTPRMSRSSLLAWYDRRSKEYGPLTTCAGNFPPAARDAQQRRSGRGEECYGLQRRERWFESNLRLHSFILFVFSNALAF